MSKPSNVREAFRLVYPGIPEDAYLFYEDQEWFAVDRHGDVSVLDNTGWDSTTRHTMRDLLYGVELSELPVYGALSCIPGEVVRAWVKAVLA